MNNFELGNKYYNNKQYKKALEYYKKSLEQGEEKRSMVLHNIGTTYLRLKYYNKAIETFQSALRDSETEYKALFNIAYCYSMKKDNKAAYRIFKLYNSLCSEDNEGAKAIKLTDPFKELRKDVKMSND